MLNFTLNLNYLTKIDYDMPSLSPTLSLNVCLFFFLVYYTFTFEMRCHWRVALSGIHSITLFLRFVPYFLEVLLIRKYANSFLLPSPLVINVSVYHPSCLAGLAQSGCNCPKSFWMTTSYSCLVISLQFSY